MLCPERREWVRETGVVFFFGVLEDEPDVDSLGAHRGFEEIMQGVLAFRVTIRGNRDKNGRFFRFLV